MYSAPGRNAVSGYFESMRPSIDKLKSRGLPEIERELKNSARGSEAIYKILLLTARQELLEEKDIQLSFDFGGGN